MKTPPEPGGDAATSIARRDASGSDAALDSRIADASASRSARAPIPDPDPGPETPRPRLASLAAFAAAAFAALATASTSAEVKSPAPPRRYRAVARTCAAAQATHAKFRVCVQGLCERLRDEAANRGGRRAERAAKLLAAVDFNGFYSGNATPSVRRDE